MQQTRISGIKSLGKHEGMESIVQIGELTLDRNNNSNRQEGRIYGYRCKQVGKCGSGNL